MDLCLLLSDCSVNVFNFNIRMFPLLLLFFMRQHFQDYNFLFNLTVAKFRHNLFKGNFLTNTAISSFSLISHSLMNEFTWVLFWQKHWPEGLENIWVMVSCVQDSCCEYRETDCICAYLLVYCSSSDPCLNHHCKKGKVCEVDESNTPMCVCQDPSTCPAAEGEFEHVSS